MITVGLSDFADDQTARLSLTDIPIVPDDAKWFTYPDGQMIADAGERRWRYDPDGKLTVHIRYRETDRGFAELYVR